MPTFRNPSAQGKRQAFLRTTGRMAGAIPSGLSRLSSDVGRCVVLVVSPAAEWTPLDWRDAPAAYSVICTFEWGMTPRVAESLLYDFNAVAAVHNCQVWAITMPANNDPSKRELVAALRREIRKLAAIAKGGTA